MTDPLVSAEVEGLEELQRKAEQMVRDLDGTPAVQAMREATLLVESAAKHNLKPWRGPGTGGVDTGRLRASIMPEVRRMHQEIQGVVGSNVLYAPYQEQGTRPHFVPAKYIGRWAERHGLGYRGVFVSGKALRFLQRAFEENLDKIRRLFEHFVKRTVDK